MSAPVVVGYDTSEQSVAAVRWAAQEALRSRSELVVVHVWGFAHQPESAASRTWLREQVLAGVQAVADEGAFLAAEAAPGVVVTAVVGHGSPAQALVDRSTEARMLVLGRHGTGWFQEMVLGSVAVAAVQHATCPVAVVPQEAVGRDPRGLVVVGTDGSAGGDGALVTAAEQAVLRGADLRVVTTWTSTPVTSSMSYWVEAYPDVTPDEVAMAAAERVQETAREGFAQDYPDLEVSWDVAEGPASHVLVRASSDADLTVVGARGLGGLAGLLLGSVSRGVVRGAHSPVLVTRS
ncbi:universal stress protein [Cellulomonas sp. P22]|uniref:universal stress protein n=1 Tax=Cellulomonas sp. P22 TaxID=3373189 RepID=UPI0037BACA6C